MRKDIKNLENLTMDLIKGDNNVQLQEEHQHLIDKIYKDDKLDNTENKIQVLYQKETYQPENQNYDFAETVVEDESLSLQDKEFEMIRKSLERNKGKRKLAAQELGISERTLYRKIKQYDL